MKTYNPNTNPRFVLVIGSICEVYPDIPDTTGSGSIVLYDRQERRPVFTLHKEYAQAICLEHTTTPEAMPFTHLENWFNGLVDMALISEGMTPTK
jgi:hypothetical protein